MKNETIQKKEILLSVCIRQEKRYLEAGDQKNADKMRRKILQIQKEIKDLKEGKPIPVSVNQSDGALQFLRSSENLNDNFREINQIGQDSVVIGIEGGKEALSNFSQEKSVMKPIAGALLKLLGLFTKYEKNFSENGQEIKISTEKDRGFYR